MKNFLYAFFFLLPLYTYGGTKIVDLTVDKSFYVAGNKALLTAVLASKPDNANMEFDLTATLNAVNLPLNRVTEHSFYAQTQALAQGSYNWTVKVFLQDARFARDLKISMQSFTDRIAAIDAALLTETDPTKIANLQAERAQKVDLRLACESQLAAIRSQVFSTFLNFNVN